MKILFVCKYNRFRSKVAEAIFNKLNKNPNNQAKSAGIVPGLPINQDIMGLCKSQGIQISNPPQGLSYQLNMWADKIIIIEDRIPKELFSEERINDKKEVIIWKIKDVMDKSGEIGKKRKHTVKLIDKKVRYLLKNQ